MDEAFIHYGNFIEEKISEFISELNTQCDIADGTLMEVWKKIKDRGMKGVFEFKQETKREQKEEHKKCEAKMKNGARKGEDCGKNVSKNSKTGRFCGSHLKQETEEAKSDDSEGIIFKKNSYGNFAFGNTGLILKSAKDHRIIGKQTSNGSIIDLSEDDINLCKQRRLAYIPNYHSSLEKQGPVGDTNTVKFTSQIPL
jgi:hypothetical protein